MRAGRRAGFTLLELSIVLMLIGVIVGGGLVMFTANLQATQYNATVARMDAIDKALFNFAIANSRLPCPADLTQTVGTSPNYYGFEAGAGSGSAILTATGVCTGTGMLPKANFTTTSGTAEGGVPTRALKLPDDYMYDGWGRKIRYAVDPTWTKASALPVPATCNPSTSAITVNDASGAARTTAAAYALISHGANGHGAYTSNGVTLSAGSTNQGEQANCHCSNSGASTAYPLANYQPSGTATGFTVATYVEHAPTIDSTSSLDGFDDIVTFKEPFQLQAPNFALASSTGCAQGQFLSVAGYTSYPNLFYVYNGVVTALPGPPAQACVGWQGCPAMDIAPGNAYVANGDTLWYGGSCTLGGSTGCTQAGNLFSLPALTSTAPSTGITYAYNNVVGNYSVQAIAFSPDGKYLAVTGFTYSTGTHSSFGGTGFLTLYSKGTGGTPYSTVASTLAPACCTEYGYGNLAWSADSTTLYANMTQWNVYYSVDVYTNSGGSLTLSKSISTSDQGWPYNVSVHPSGNYIAVSGNTNSSGYYGPYVLKNPTGSSTQISVAGSGALTPPWGSVAWSPDGNFLGGVVTSGVTGSATTVVMYGFNPANAPVYFTPETITNCGSSDIYGAVSFSKDSQYFAVAGTYNNPSPSLCIYKRNNSTGTVWTNIYTNSSISSQNTVTTWSK